MRKKIILIFLIVSLGHLISVGILYYKTKESTRFMNLLQMKNRDFYPLGNEQFYGLPLNNPPFLKANTARHMRDDDLIIGINYGGIIRAYPAWIISSYNIINDSVNGKPILITFCKDCQSAGAFLSTLPHLKNRSLSYVTCMYKENLLSICDLQTSSIWNPFSGKGIEGPAKGAQLARIPVKILKWKDWLRVHPNSDVIDSSEEQRSRITLNTDKFHQGHTHLK